jgi:hypothetical protein
VYRDRDVIAQCLQNPQLLAREAVDLGMRRRENAHQSITDMQRYGNFRERIVLARNVVLIFTNVGRVTHLACGCNVANHSLDADFQAISFAVQAASAYPGQHHVSAFFVVQINPGFQTTEGKGHFIDDALNELVEIEN